MFTAAAVALCLASSIQKPPFERSATIAVGPQAGRPLIADLNRDGIPDLAVPCGACCGSEFRKDSGHVAILLGNGRGGFTPAAGSPVKVAPSVLKVALGDFDEDGSPDLVAIEHSTYNVSLLLNDGKGGFRLAGAPVASRSGPRAHTHDVAAGDVNGDGHVDAVVANCNDNTLSVLLGDGKGGLSPSPSSPVDAGYHPYEGLVLRDLNGDGLLDAATVNLHGNALMVLHGDGKGGFAPAPGYPIPMSERPAQLVTGDLNGDGRSDLLVVHDDTWEVRTLLAGEAGAFRDSGARFTTGHHAWGATIGDFDGDGVADVALADFKRGVHICPGDGKGSFGRPMLLPMQDGPMFVQSADLNGDGRLDLVASSYSGGTVTVFLAVKR